MIRTAHLGLLRGSCTPGVPTIWSVLGAEQGLRRSEAPGWWPWRCRSRSPWVDRHAVVKCDQNIRRLDVPVDNALLVGVLDAVADLGEEIEALPGIQLLGVAVFKSGTPRMYSITK